MSESFRIVKKPDWVTWEEIHQVLVVAHADNRSRGIQMRKPSLPGEGIAKEIGDNGIMLVALDDDRVIGTAAIIPKHNKTWYNDGAYAYMCFASVLPEYSGKGVYKSLCVEREIIAREMGLNKLFFDTHHRNARVLEINKKNGFKEVAVKNCGPHWNIVLFKWLDGCPYSDFVCGFHFCLSLLYYYVIRTGLFLRQVFKLT